MRPFRPNPAPAHGTASRELLRIPLRRREIVVRQTRIAPGGSSGPHYHDGTLFVLVTRGVLDHPGLDGPAVYRRGRVFKEPSGPEHAHIARNTGGKSTAILVCYLQPTGSPLSRSTGPLPGI
ncbi:cupin domain-containing protein [Nocardia carnea]|uniref:cupin domain-containing protein n=1 Tax=Nocardia carnea TaxID=37328 RepID=UPI00245715AE|nr:cupin domain-containing protein [Nocardia carnea]